MSKILIIEDNIETQHLLKRTLAPIHSLQVASTLESAWNYIKHENWDVVILDRSLPDGDGLDLCAKLKNCNLESKFSILMLTAHGELEEKIKGLTAGADDYVVKPFEPRELLARIEAVQRRRAPNQSEFKSVITLEDLVINVETHVVGIKTPSDEVASIDMTPIEFKILLTLVKNYDKYIDRTQLIQAVWDNVALSSRNIDTHVCHLRKKISASHLSIKNSRGKGYSISKSSASDQQQLSSQTTKLPHVKESKWNA